MHEKNGIGNGNMFASWISSSKVYLVDFAKVRRQTLPTGVQIARNFQSRYQKINSKTFQTSYAAWLLATYMLVR